MILNGCILVATQVTTISRYGIRNFAALAVFLMWIKLFYWMRLFGPTQAFMRMISQILIDSAEFFLMLSICVLTFGNTLYVLNGNRYDDELPLF